MFEITKVTVSAQHELCFIVHARDEIMHVPLMFQ